MKTLLFFITLFSLNSFADYMNRDCEKNANISVSITIKDRSVYPKFIYAKENDILCFEIVNQADNSVSFSIERQPLTDSLKSGFSRNYSLRFLKVGEYKIKLRGVYLSEVPKVIILDKTTYENLEREEAIKKSIQIHH
jgi:hypothetical protein